MFIRILGALFTLCLAACSTETATTPDTPDPVEVMLETLTGEHLRTEIPETWLKIRDTKSPMLHLAEYVPPQTGEAWTEKLSVESLLGDDLPDPLQFLQGMAADQSELCSEFSDSPIFAGHENGFETVVRLLECRVNECTQLPIVTMIKVIRGDEALYTVTRIWRLSEPAQEGEPLALSPQALAEWSSALKNTYVCNPGVDDHPCEKS